LVTDSNSLPEQWAAAVIMGRRRLEELIIKNHGPVFIQLGQQAKDHVTIVKKYLFEESSNAKEATTAEPRSIEFKRSNNGSTEDQAGTQDGESATTGKAGKGTSERQDDSALSEIIAVAPPETQTPVSAKPTGDAEGGS
jgi:hypothetical protein